MTGVTITCDADIDVIIDGEVDTNIETEGEDIFVTVADDDDNN
jgi:hypothetical protein